MQGLNKLVLGAFAAVLLINGPAIAQDVGAGDFVCDVEKGERVFKRCSSCHTIEEAFAGRKQGPTLYGLFNRTSGTVEGFKYSKAMIEAEIVWTQDTLFEYLENPRKYVPRSKMPFRVAKDQERRDLICFLRDVTGPAAADPS